MMKMFKLGFAIFVLLMSLQLIYSGYAFSGTDDGAREHITPLKKAEKEYFAVDRIVPSINISITKKNSSPLFDKKLINTYVCDAFSKKLKQESNVIIDGCDGAPTSQGEKHTLLLYIAISDLPDSRFQKTSCPILTITARTFSVNPEKNLGSDNYPEDLFTALPHCSDTGLFKKEFVSTFSGIIESIAGLVEFAKQQK